MVHVLFQLVIGGLAMGAVYALVALGFTLIWNAVGIVNFAQGDVVMLGAYFVVGWCVDMWHLPVGIDLLVMLAFMALFGWAFATFVYRPVRNAPQLSAIVATLGLGMVLENSVVLIWGPEAMSSAGPFGNSTLQIVRRQDLRTIPADPGCALAVDVRAGGHVPFYFDRTGDARNRAGC